MLSRQTSLNALIALALLAAGLGQTHAAEFRTHAGEKPLVRTVSYERPASPVAAEAPREALWSPGEVHAVHATPAPCPKSCRRACCSPRPFWAEFEYLHWWRRGQHLPPLVTTDPNNGLLPGATILFGGERVGDDDRPGGRVTIGSWLCPKKIVGIAGGYFALATENVRFRAESNGDPLLARPFRDSSIPGLPQQRLIVADAATAGAVDVHTSSDVMGADAYFRWLLWRTPRARFDLLTGYQFSRIDEELLIRQTSQAQNLFNTFDLFDTENEFHGGEIGLIAELRRGSWELNFLAKVGLGNMAQTVTIDGQSMTDGVPKTNRGGLLAHEGLNIGRRSRDEFAAVPELGLNFVYHASCCMSVSFGYSFIYWSNVVQPGDQIDVAADGTPVVHGQLLTDVRTGLEDRPQFRFIDTDYWVQGLNLAIQFRF